MATKHIFNNFQCVCGTVFHDISIDERNRDTVILDLLHCRENLSCTSLIKIPYCTCNIFSKICYHCGSNKRLLHSCPVFYPQCECCQLKNDKKLPNGNKWLVVTLAKVKNKKLLFDGTFSPNTSDCL